MIAALSFMKNYLNTFSEPLFNTGFMASAVCCSFRSLYCAPTFLLCLVPDYSALGGTIKYQYE